MKKTETKVEIKEVRNVDLMLNMILLEVNMRRHYDEKRMAELTENIKKIGVLEPILVRPTKLKIDEYFIIAGYRRFMAAKEAGLKIIPARVMDVDEKAAAEIQALENLHREDLTPIEEAQAFRQLMEKSGYSIKDLAERVDKSEAYVYRAVRLLELPEKAIKAIEEGKITAAHGHQILRAAPNKRESLIDYALKPGDWSKKLPTIDDLKLQIEKTMEKKLSYAFFPKDREYAGKEACSSCQFNSGNQDMLFDGAKEGNCTNGVCYNSKNNQAQKDFSENSAKRFQGLQFIGCLKDRGWSSELASPKGWTTLNNDRANSKAIKASLKKSPEKFGYIILIKQEYNSKPKMHAYLCCKDTKTIEKSKEEFRQETEDERNKRNFVEGRVKLALFLNVLRKITPIKKEHLILSIDPNKLNHEIANTLFGIGDYEEKKIKQLTEQQLIQLLILQQISHWDVKRDAEAFGVNVDTVEKTTVMVANEEWNQQHKDASSEPKKEKKAKK